MPSNPATRPESQLAVVDAVIVPVRRGSLVPARAGDLKISPLLPAAPPRYVLPRPRLNRALVAAVFGSLGAVGLGLAGAVAGLLGWSGPDTRLFLLWPILAAVALGTLGCLAVCLRRQP